MEGTHPTDRTMLIQTGFTDPIAIALAGSLLQEAGIPYFVIDANVSTRQESGNVIGWWNISVPAEMEAEVREILDAITQQKASGDKPEAPGSCDPSSEAESQR